MQQRELEGYRNSHVSKFFPTQLCCRNSGLGLCGALCFGSKAPKYGIDKAWANHKRRSH